MEQLLTHVVAVLVTFITVSLLAVWISFRAISKRMERACEKAKDEGYREGLLSLMESGLSVKNPEMWELLHLFAVERQEMEKATSNKEWLQNEAKKLAHDAATEAANTATHTALKAIQQDKIETDRVERNQVARDENETTTRRVTPEKRRSAQVARNRRPSS